MTPIEKIVVHPGAYHADDIVCIALGRMINPNIEVIRTRDKLKQYIKNKYVIVADVGMIHDPETNNYDHHQDMSLSAACVLMWDSFGHYICSKELYAINNHLNIQIDNSIMINEIQRMTSDIKDNVYNRFLHGVSSHDTGGHDSMINEHSRQLGLLHFSNMVSLITEEDIVTEEDIEFSIVMTIKTIKGLIYKLYNEYNYIKEFKTNRVNLYDGNNNIDGGPIEVILLKKDIPSYILSGLLPSIHTVKYLVKIFTKNNVQKYRVESIDSDLYPLPDPIKGEDCVFLHQSKYLAVFRTSEGLLKYVGRTMGIVNLAISM